MSESLQLVAWCLNLCAWGLKLAAWPSTLLRRFSEDPSELDAWSLKLVACVVSCSRRDGARRRSLVFGVNYIRNRPVPACTAVSAFIILKSSRTGAVSCTYSTGPRPACHRFLINHMT